MKANLPGVRPDDVTIEVQQGQLVIRGQTDTEQERKEGSYHIRERRSGRFARTITLPGGVNADQAAATFEHGVLMVRLPKVAEAKPQRIQIQAAAPASQSLPVSQQNEQASPAPTS